MQDRYAGDAGDFVKFGLLRLLCREDDIGPRLKLGVVWYLVADEDHNGDGRHVSYLAPQSVVGRRMARCDQDLYDRLRRIVGSGERNVRAIERSGILPPDTKTFSKRLTLARVVGKRQREARLAFRASWVQSAVEATDGCDLVFLDPDNGIRTDERLPRHRTLAAKHAYLDEVEPYVQRDQSVVVYHHADRSADVQTQAHRRLDQLRAALGADSAFAVRALRGSARLFLIVPSARHRLVLEQRASRISSGGWANEALVYQ